MTEATDENELLNRSVSQIHLTTEAARRSLPPLLPRSCGDSSAAAEKAATENQTGSGMYHPIVKEQVFPGQLEGLQTNVNYRDWMLLCQGEIPSIFEIPCGKSRVRFAVVALTRAVFCPYGHGTVQCPL